MSVLSSYTIENRLLKMEAMSTGLALDFEKMGSSISIINELEILGINYSISKVILCLFHHPNSSSIELQEGCDLRQPEISQAVKNLENLNILKKTKVKNMGRGRPSYRYSLSKSLPECVAALLAIEEEKIDKQLQQIAKINSLAKAISGKSE